MTRTTLLLIAGAVVAFAVVSRRATAAPLDPASMPDNRRYLPDGDLTGFTASDRMNASAASRASNVLQQLGQAIPSVVNQPPALAVLFDAP